MGKQQKNIHIRRFRTLIKVGKRPDGAGYAVPMLYVPSLFWTHLLVLWLLLPPGHASALSADAPVSLAATEQPKRDECDGRSDQQR